MNDIIANFLGWLNAVIALLKFFIQIIAFCLPISLFLLLVWQLFWFIKTFLSKIENQEGVENLEVEGESDLNLDNIKNAN